MLVSGKRFNRGFTLVLMALLAAGFLIAGCSAGKQAAGGGAQQAAPGPQKQAGFEEFPIGEEKEVEGLRIAAVYFQPVTMEPADKAGLGPDKADIHLEADVQAVDGRYGFGVGEFVPYLSVKYRLKNLSNGEEAEGTLMPMNASDGPHYGANVKMLGAGKYQLTYVIESPEKQDFLLHTDKETGVEGRFWTKPLEVQWEFNFLPRKW